MIHIIFIDYACNQEHWIRRSLRMTNNRIYLLIIEIEWSNKFNIKSEL